MKQRAVGGMAAEQMDLFGGMDAPVLLPTRRPRAVRVAANQPIYRQMTLAPDEAAADLLPRLVLDDDDYPVHRLTSASKCDLPADIGPASIFHAGAAAALCNLMRNGLPGEDTAAPAIHRRIVRDGANVVHFSMRLQDTEEWREKEERRRARQKPPRPPKQKFKMKNSRQWAAP